MEILPYEAPRNIKMLNDELYDDIIYLDSSDSDSEMDSEYEIEIFEIPQNQETGSETESGSETEDLDDEIIEDIIFLDSSESETEMENEIEEQSTLNQVEFSKESDENIKENANNLTTKIEVNEDLTKIQIKIEFFGRKFKPEDLEIQVIDQDILSIKAGNEYEKKFKLCLTCQIDKIESEFNCKNEEKQILTVKIPKNVNIVNVPISSVE